MSGSSEALYDPGKSRTLFLLLFGWVTKQVSVLCETACDIQAGPTIGMTKAVLGILADAMGLVHCCDIFPQERDYILVYSLGKES